MRGAHWGNKKIDGVVCGLAITCAAFAQTGGTVTGTVVDIAGDPVSKAEIQATNSATNAVYKAATSAQGVYTLVELPAGTYQLSSMTQGFAPFAREGVSVSAGMTVTLNLRFEDVQLNTLGDGRDFFTSFRSRHPAVAGPTPRLPDGKPDFSGVWYNQRTVDPGKPEMKPWAEAIKKERDDNFGKDSPPTRCLPNGPALSNVSTAVWRAVDTPAYMVMISEGDTPGYRQIYLDGRSHPKDFGPTWTGHSIGFWEGDTLVVDTVGFNDESWLPDWRPHTEKMHLTERYRRPDLGHIEIELTIDDPDTFSKPWVIKRTADLAPNEEVLESICTENERDQMHMPRK